jgi:hypothetical protein
VTTHAFEQSRRQNRAAAGEGALPW